MEQPRGGRGARDQQSVRGLLIMVFVPVVIILGMLATAVLGSGGRDVQAPLPGISSPAVTQPPAPPAEPAPPTTPLPVPDATVPAGQVPPSPLPQPDVAAPPPVAPAPVPVVPPGPAAEADPYTPAGVERLDVGEGAQAAAIFRTPGTTARAVPVVIFLHGWVALDPERYGPWIGHIARGGATVIFPAYQTKPAYDTVAPLANVLAGVRGALAQVQLAPGRLVVAGHSAGGALAADYAAVAADNGLPAPAAVLSVYPGRKLRHLPEAIPPADLGKIAADTRVIAFVGERDTAVGSGTANRIIEGAAQTGPRLRIIRDDAVDDHSAPRRFDGTAQRTFWEPLDALLAETAQHVP